MQALDHQVSANEQLTWAESDAWRKWTSEKRKRKKRRRKKLPKASSSRSSRGACAVRTRKSGHSPTSPSSGFCSVSAAWFLVDTRSCVSVDACGFFSFFST